MRFSQGHMHPYGERYQPGVPVCLRQIALKEDALLACMHTMWETRLGARVSNLHERGGLFQRSKQTAALWLQGCATGMLRPSTGRIVLVGATR